MLMNIVANITCIIMAAIVPAINYRVAVQLEVVPSTLVFENLVSLKTLAHISVGEPEPMHFSFQVLNILSSNSYSLFEAALFCLLSATILMLTAFCAACSIQGPQLSPLVSGLEGALDTIQLQQLTGTEFRVPAGFVPGAFCGSSHLNFTTGLMSTHLKEDRKGKKKLLEKAGFVQSRNCALAPFVSSIAVMLTFSCHILRRHKLIEPVAFSVIAMFNVIKFAIEILPSSVKAMAEANVSLRRMKGKIVGICGNVGSGKSSLLSAVLGQVLLLHMQLQKGVVAVNGTLAYIPQQVWIFHGNVRKKNILEKSMITKGRKGCEMNRFTVPQFPHLKNELSMVQTRVREVWHGLSVLLPGQKFIVDHLPLQSLESCDEVTLLEDGDICETGRHKELMEERGHYAKLIYNLQGLQFKHPEHLYNAAMVEAFKENPAKREEDAGRTAVPMVQELNTQMCHTSLTGGFQVTCGPQGNRTTCEVGTVLAGIGQHVYQWVYAASMVSVLVFGDTKGFTFTKITLMAFFSLYDMVFDKLTLCGSPQILKSPMSFFDMIPTGRVMNRFSKDMEELDVRLLFHTEGFLKQFSVVVFILIMLASVLPNFLIVVVMSLIEDTLSQ
ncbi:Multidrug resistance-associated protein 9 [Plecturocebus cupreus]